MSLTQVVGLISGHLATAMAAPPANVGTVAPSGGGDVPAVTISLRDVEQPLVSIGARPAQTRRGSLPVERSFDLARPAVTFPDGETVNLLSLDRRSLHFPFGPVVSADGAEVESLGSADLTVAVNGAPLPVTEATPGPGEVSGDPAAGEVRFGSPLPTVGSLDLAFFIGEWETETRRYRGELVVDVAAADAGEVETVSADVEAALLDRLPGPPGLLAVRPVALDPILRSTSPPRTHQRQMLYSFEVELERPTLGTGGGVIDLVAVASTLGAETFEVPVLAP